MRTKSYTHSELKLIIINTLQQGNPRIADLEDIARVLDIDTDANNGVILTLRNGDPCVVMQIILTLQNGDPNISDLQKIGQVLGFGTKGCDEDRLCKDCGKSCKRVPKDGRCKRCTKAQAYYVDYPINNK